MNNFQIPAPLMNMFKGGNIQQVAMNLLQSRAGNNEMAQNVLNMVNNGDMSGIENTVRQMCGNMGINPDEMMKQVQGQFK